MKRLRAAEHGGKCLVGNTDHVVQWLLRGEGHATGLGMEAHDLGSLVRRGVALAHHPQDQSHDQRRTQHHQ